MYIHKKAFLMGFILWSYFEYTYRVLKIAKNKHWYRPVTNSTQSELVIFLWLQENTQAIHFDTNLEYFYLIVIV